MRPRRYPYSGKIKKPIGQSIDFTLDDFTIDEDAILQFASRISQSKHPISDLKKDKHMAI